MRTYADSVVNKFVTETNGTAGAGALVTVYTAGSTVKAPLFDVLGAAITNPLSADGEGNYAFKVVDGTYDIIINLGTLSETKLSNIQIAEIVSVSSISASYPSLANAVATNIDLGEIITTSGYYADGDGGGGQYTIVAGGSGPADGGSFINMTNGNQLRLSGHGVINCKVWGAKGDGVTDDKIAIQSAINFSTRAKIYFPSGVYVVSGQLLSTDQFIEFSGDGPRASSILYTGSNGLFRLVRTGEENAFYKLTDLLLDTTTINAGAAIQIEQDQASGVIGGVDFLHIESIIADSSVDGYWTHGLHTVSAGGVYISNTSFRNNNNAVAQNDPNTKGIFIDGSNSSINVIRSLSISNFYIQRYNRGIEINCTNTVESIYGVNGEIVGCDYGVYSSGAGVTASITFTNVHIDPIKGAIKALNDFSVFRIQGCDLRAGQNGASGVYQDNIAISIARGETIVINGNNFSGTNALAPLIDSVGVNLGLAQRTIISNNTFRNYDTGIITPTVHLEFQIGLNHFIFVVEEVTGDARPNNSSLLVDNKQAAYGGDLNDITDGIAQGIAFTKLNDSVTNKPPVTTIGAMLETLVFDTNAATQKLYLNYTDDVYSRRKQGGVWQTWVIT
jgi:hypothetical protein